ncbi:MAG: glutamine synthetase, partial [Dehalococcoidia bacterium]
EMPEAERHKRGIGQLPGSLFKAIEMADGSDLLRTCLGDHLYGSLLTNKKIEWDTYHRQVTDYEIKRYLPML